MDEKITQMKKNIVEIIINYCQKFIDISDDFDIQYLIYILLSRLYSCKYEKYQKLLNPLLVNSIINMCFFKGSPMGLISLVINKILTLEKKEHSQLKNLLTKKLKESENKDGFLYLQKPLTKEQKSLNEEDLEEIISEESLILFQSDLKFGFYNKEIINAGENFIFYEEIKHSFSILHFYLNLDDLDINFTITDLTLDKKIYKKERIYSEIDTPLKIIMIFSDPKILKFEFDNSYSWFRSKTIKYKVNIFYPEFPYKINEKILVGKYIKDIKRKKAKINLLNIKRAKTMIDNEIQDKLLIIKINGHNKVFNCKNVEDNLKAIASMKKDKYLLINSIFIKIKEKEGDKSYFYFHSKTQDNKENNYKLIEKELTKENFENYLKQIIIDITNINIVNLFITNKFIDLEQNPLKKILGFDPILNSEESFKKILFIFQNLCQTQLLYYIYKKYSGFKINFFNNGEIINLIEEFTGLNKDANIEENTKIIYEGIKKLKFSEGKQINIILGNCGSDNYNESNILLNKLKENIIIQNEENKNINIIVIDKEFNNEFLDNSHIFYLNK